MKWLIVLYPKAWRERYADEFEQLLDDLEPRRSRLRMNVDIAQGAMDARLQRSMSMLRNPAVRRGIYDGLIVSAAIAVLVVLTNVVFPGGPNESDGDPEYVVQWFITVGVLALLLVAIGARGRRRQPQQRLSGMFAGAWAGGVLAVMVTMIFLVVNNVWFDIVSQQHDKRVAFATSGWTSMRAYINVTQLRGGIFLLVMLGVVGAMLGLIGGLLFGGAKQPVSSLHDA
jgi:hypothetical protein